MKRSRQDRTVTEKLELLSRYKALPPLSQREAAERLGISRGFLQNLLRDEVAIRATDPSLNTVKRKRAGKDELVEYALFEWFQVIRQKNVAVNGPILMHIANFIAQDAGHTDFQATNGWFYRWKKRYGVTFSYLKSETDHGGVAPKVRDEENVVKDSDDEIGPKEATPSAATMRDCLRRLALGLKRTAFKNMDMFNVLNTEIDDHLSKTFPIKQTTS